MAAIVRVGIGAIPDTGGNPLIALALSPAPPRHLLVTGYDALQSFVHRGHRETADIVLELLGARPGDTVVEIGCGTGAVARQIIARGFDYVGVDPDRDRVEAATRLTEGGRFLVGEAGVLETVDVPANRRVFIHGVLHHLDDEYATWLVGYLLAWTDTGRVVVSEPIRPDRWWRNPAGELAMLLDEGQHTRREREWFDLFGEMVDHARVRNLWPRWPVSMLDLRLSVADDRLRDSRPAVPVE
jgi:SAM-dependent methyltransferase